MRDILLTHWLELRHQLLLGPLLLLPPKSHGVGDQHLVVVGVGNVQIVDQDNVRILKIFNKMVVISFVSQT